MDADCKRVEAPGEPAGPWAQAAAFMLWRLLDGGHVRPVDLRMLAAR